MNRRTVLASLAMIATAGVSAPIAYDGLHSAWNELYPESLSDDNVVNGPLGQNCYLCHYDNHEWNGYGWWMRELLHEGYSPTDALLALESRNSDGDPTGATNLEEIEAGTQPGWSSGPTNTTYHKDGTVVTNRQPPEGILGEVDPACLVPAQATLRNGSGVNPPCLVSQTSPILGSPWELRVDATGIPGANSSVLHCRTLPSSGVFLGVGEILVDLTSPLVFTSFRQFDGDVSLHRVLIPTSPEFLGFTATVQGIVVGDEGILRLCNAEDFVLGCAAE